MILHYETFGHRELDLFDLPRLQTPNLTNYSDLSSRNSHRDLHFFPNPTKSSTQLLEFPNPRIRAHELYNFDLDSRIHQLTYQFSGLRHADSHLINYQDLHLPRATPNFTIRLRQPPPPTYRGAHCDNYSEPFRRPPHNTSSTRTLYQLFRTFPTTSPT